ncbi:hypothetical protein [Nonomuraea cavernae]|uniref:hypothetical protein n=1 Tax=Nonomuraea cavernae TaxID=2045107 RepID=UPI0033CCD3AA
MSMLLNRIPELTIQPRATVPVSTTPAGAAEPRHLVPKMERRGFLRVAFAGAATLALTAFGWITDRLPAFAATRTSMHPSDCMGVNVSGDTPCWGRTYISKSYCASDLYHRVDRVTITGGYRKYNWEAACGTYAGWSWKMSTGQAVTCFDGYYNNYVNGVNKGKVTTCCKSI